jgi:DNA-binding NtrC family response regulator
MKQSLNIIIVEDSEDDARLLAQELERAQYEVAYERVETAETLRSALGRNGWDIVCCDFTLPRFNGQSALRIVKERDQDLPFIYVSGTIGEDKAVEAMKAGAQDYVMKNNLARLVPAVERELREAASHRELRLAELDRQRLIVELQAALGEVKRLSGRVPICSRCKRIRDDAGSWQEVENFIQQRSEARFSHAICPDCLGRMQIDYPEMQDLLRD